MPHTLANAERLRQRLLPEKAGSPAKVAVTLPRKAEIWQVFGRAIALVRYEACLSLKEFAAALGDRDERQVAAWERGDERPQLEAVFAIARFKAPLVIALARQVEDVSVETVVRTAKGGGRVDTHQ